MPSRSESPALQARPAAGPASHFAELYEDAPVAYLVLDEDARVQELNRAGSALLGWSADWPSGRQLRRWILADDLSLFESHLESVLRAGTARQRLRLKTRSGQVRDVLLETRLSSNAGRVRRCLAVMIDVSEHERGERLARAEQAKLLHADRLGMMGEMASSLAHELSQPLGAILLNANACVLMAARDPAGRNLRLCTALERICESATYAGGIIHHLRRFLRAADGERRIVDLNAVVVDAARIIEPAALDENVIVHLDLTKSLPKVLGDAVQIEQVLLNLVRNGIDAMDKCAARQVTVRTMKLSDDQVAFSVADSGPGISKQVASRLFEPFFTTKADGMGLGLSISRTIVEAHMGRLWWAADAVPGATFICALPIGDRTPE
jgi:PAS domain S-box-containing protein